MKKASVRCWKAHAKCDSGEVVDVYYTVPDFGDQYELFTCLNCGEIFAVHPDAEYYSGVPFEELKQRLRCPVCSEPLKYAVKYPDTYLCPQSKVKGSWVRGSRFIPPDDESTIQSFWDPYST